jgi:hypothetical protein
MMKSGWKTSEFWMMMISIAAPLFGLPVEPLSAVGAGLYAAARAGLKVKQEIDKKEA